MNSPTATGKGIYFILNAINFGLKQNKSITDFDSSLVLLLTVSIFLPFYVSVVVISLIAVMTVINHKKRAEAFEEPYSKFIVCTMGVTFLISVVYANHTGMMYSLVLVAILVTAFYIRSIMTRQLFNKMMDVACLSSMACAMIAVFQKISVYSTAPNYRPVSTFTNANYYGMMIEFIVLIALYRLLTNKQDNKFYFIVIGVNLIGLYLSASMSSFIAMACASLVIMLLKGRYKMAAVFVLLAGSFVLCSVLLPKFFPRIWDIDHTFDQRLNIWSTALKGIEQHPLFGQGPATYPMIVDEFAGYKTYHCHNLFLDTLLNYGFVGASAIAFYVFTQIKVLVARFKNNICTNMNILVAAAFVAVIVHGFTDVTIFWNQTGMLFLLMFSSTGIHSAYTNRNLHIPQGMPLLPGYANRVGAHATYSKD